MDIPTLREINNVFDLVNLFSSIKEIKVKASVISIISTWKNNNIGKVIIIIAYISR